MKKAAPIAVHALPVFAMVGLIPLVENDYLLAAIYALAVLALLTLTRTPNDILVFTFGFCIMIVSEYFFVSTGVETFARRTLLGVMPLWLPVLWGYGFVAIKRAIAILDA